VSLVADLITVTGYCVACHRRTSCAKYSGAGCSGAGGPSVHWILHIVARFTRHRSTDTLCLTAWKPLHTAEPLCFSELICHYLPSRSLHSSNTFLLARPSVWSLLATFRRHFSSWNSVHIRSIEKPPVFKRQLKCHLFQSASAVWSLCQRLSFVSTLYVCVRMHD